MEQMETIKELINQGDVNKAIEALVLSSLNQTSPEKSEVYYLRVTLTENKEIGNKPSTIINPLLRSTRKARLCKPCKMVMDILEFYHKDMYNQ